MAKGLVKKSVIGITLVTTIVVSLVVMSNTQHNGVVTVVIDNDTYQPWIPVGYTINNNGWSSIYVWDFGDRNVYYAERQTLPKTWNPIPLPQLPQPTGSGVVLTKIKPGEQRSFQKNLGIGGKDVEGIYRLIVEYSMERKRTHTHTVRSNTFLLENTTQ